MFFPLILVAFSIVAPAHAGSSTCYRYETINVDGDKPTSWWGLNDFGTVVGNYCTEAGCNPFNVEGAVLELNGRDLQVVENALGVEPGFVQESDVNNWGTAAGYAFDFATSTGVAYRRTAQGKIYILPPFSDDTRQQVATGINDWGWMVGLSELDNGDLVGWLWHPFWGFTLVDASVKEFDGFLPSDINNWGTVVGTLENAEGETVAARKGLLARRARTFGPVGIVTVGGNNDWGQVVGSVFDESFIGTGFLYSRWGGLRTLDVPNGGGGVALEGINNAGVIAITTDFGFEGVIGFPCEKDR